MKKKNKLTKGIVIILVVIFLVVFGSLYLIKINSTSYKLEKLGYTKEEVKILMEKLEDRDIENTINGEHNPDLPKILQEKYFIYSNLYDYLKFAEEYDEYKSKTDDLKNSNDDKKYYNIVAIVNVGANKDWYTDIKDSDLGKENKVLVNKFYKLPSDYIHDNLVDVSYLYAYGNQKVTQEVYDQFLEMWHEANRDGVKLIIESAYRSYDVQNNLYNRYTRDFGKKYADSFSARPGHSEHQTGLAIDVTTNEPFDSSEDENAFENTNAFKWLQENAHKYGFILRYPKGKTYLTGYSYESWHYRYVGVEVATKIYELDITFDEYYAFFEK